ncbi:MAG: TetR family transcriptional regulator [Solobacterium sp.]|nr:TetR family transcriptional regulator [Solobacterium sp.]MBR2669205.1 TetR family transcriptional regulator [Solobacterium sp.]
MIKGTPELIAGRREEIINACEKLYQTMSFKEITLKEIGNVVPFSRPTIYNYFQTKEEIFLALFEREYDRWNKDLTAILDGYEQMTRKELSEKIAASLAGREQLLKLLSMNNYDMEAESRQELLTSFKKSYGRSLELMNMLFQKYCPEMSEQEIRKLIYIFFPFMFGIYPYTSVTEKQRTAMNDAGISFEYQSVYKLVYNCLIRLLEEDKKEKE